MDEIPLITSSVYTPLENFWTAVLLYHDRPNIVNRKLAAASTILFCEVILKSVIKRFADIFTWESLIYESRKIADPTTITADFIKSITEVYDQNVVIQETSVPHFKERLNGTFISVRILLARQNINKVLEIVIFDKEKRTATFFAVQEQENHSIAPRFPYHIQLTKEGALRILVNSFEDADTDSAGWLVEKLFPKILNWSSNDVDESKIIKSLTLIPTDEYCNLYVNLKTKYGKELVEKWPQKAKTDPQKYVFEDIAIATYLVCLWKKLQVQDVNFVDCGCGNGLLVYILNKEGFKGCGYDIRRRTVWDIYSDETDLKIGTITPESRFPEANWLIGNHSDELTPWIPILALNSSQKANFFVLPCCAYDLNGRKYIRKNTGVSQYCDYLNHVKSISEMCGFDTSIDKLRIPSTKRTCLVGLRNKQLNFQDVKSKLLENNSVFTPREANEKVRNCTKVDNGLKKRIIQIVVAELLQEKNLLEKQNGEFWNKGGTIELGTLSKKIPGSDKKQIKNECGGLQTLLKNHRYIFEVNKGSVSLRKPPNLKETEKYKDKWCWFVKNHPDGCFHQSSVCAYNHLEM